MRLGWRLLLWTVSLAGFVAALWSLKASGPIALPSVVVAENVVKTQSALPSLTPTAPRAAVEPTATREEVEPLLSSDDGQAILNSSDIDQLLRTSGERSRLLKAAAAIARAASSCIRAGDCRDAPDPERAFYDPSHGHVFRALANSLELLQAAQATGAPGPNLPIDGLIGNLSIPQSDIQLTSLELAMNSGRLDAVSWSAVLDHAPEVEGEAKSMYFALLQQGAPPELRGAVVETLSRSLANDEPATVLEVLRGFNRLKLSQAEFQHAEQSLCPMIQANTPEGNSRAAAHYLRAYATERGFAVNGCGA